MFLGLDKREYILKIINKIHFSKNKVLLLNVCLSDKIALNYLVGWICSSCFLQKPVGGVSVFGNAGNPLAAAIKAQRKQVSDEEVTNGPTLKLAARLEQNLRVCSLRFNWIKFALIFLSRFFPLKFSMTMKNSPPHHLTESDMSDFR